MKVNFLMGLTLQCTFAEPVRSLGRLLNVFLCLNHTKIVTATGIGDQQDAHLPVMKRIVRSPFDILFWISFFAFSMASETCRK